MGRREDRRNEQLGTYIVTRSVSVEGKDLVFSNFRPRLNFASSAFRNDRLLSRTIRPRRRYGGSYFLVLAGRPSRVHVARVASGCGELRSHDK